MMCRRWLFRAGILTVLLWLPRSVYGQSIPLAADKRLGTPITIAVEAETLEKTLKDLRAAGGAKTPPLTAVPRVAYDRVTVFARDVPLYDVLLGLSELLDYDADPLGSETAPTGYQFIQHARSRRYDEKMWRDTVSHAFDPLLHFASYTKTPPVEWQRRYKAEEFSSSDGLLERNAVKFLGYPQAHAGFRFLQSLSPDIRARLVENEIIYLNYRELPADQREQIRRIFTVDPDAWDWDHSRPFTAEEIRKLNQDTLRWLETTPLPVTAYKDPRTGMLTQLNIGGFFMRQLPLMGNLSAQKTLLEKRLLPVRGRPYQDGRTESEALYEKLSQTPFPADFKLPANPIYTWSEILAELAKHLPMPLYSDAFSGAREPELFRAGYGPPPPTLKGVSLAEGLDNLCKGNGQLWWTDGKALYFRSRAWWVEKRYEVSPPAIERFARQLGPKGEMTPAAITTLSSLTIEQFIGLGGSANALFRKKQFRYDTYRGSAYFEARLAYPFLRPFSRLSPAQRDKALMKGESKGLEETDMTPEQRIEFRRVADLIHASPSRPPSLLLRVSWGAGTPPALKSRIARLSFIIALKVRYAGFTMLLPPEVQEAKRP